MIKCLTVKIGDNYEMEKTYIWCYIKKKNMKIKMLIKKKLMAQIVKQKNGYFLLKWNCYYLFNFILVWYKYIGGRELIPTIKEI